MGRPRKKLIPKHLPCEYNPDGGSHYFIQGKPTDGRVEGVCKYCGLIDIVDDGNRNWKDILVGTYGV